MPNRCSQQTNRLPWYFRGGEGPTNLDGCLGAVAQLARLASDRVL